MTVISGQRGKKAFLEGDADAGIIACGLGVGLIDRLKTVREVIHEIVEGAKEIHQRLGNILLQ